MKCSLLQTFEKVDLLFQSRITEQELQIGLFRVPIPNYEKEAFREGLVNAFSASGLLQNRDCSGAASDVVYDHFKPRGIFGRNNSRQYSHRNSHSQKRPSCWSRQKNRSGRTNWQRNRQNLKAWYTRQRGWNTLQEQELILSHLSKYKTITREGAAELCRCTSNHATWLLRHLTSQNKIKLCGSGRGAHYEKL